MLTTNFFRSGFGAASGSHFVVEAVGDVSEDEEHWGGYQKERLLDNATADNNDIWMMNDRLNFALDGEGHLDDLDDEDENSDCDDVAVDDEGGEGKGKGKTGNGGNEEVAWSMSMSMARGDGLSSSIMMLGRRRMRSGER